MKPITHVHLEPFLSQKLWIPSGGIFSCSCIPPTDMSVRFLRPLPVCLSILCPDVFPPTAFVSLSVFRVSRCCIRAIIGLPTGLTSGVTLHDAAPGGSTMARHEQRVRDLPLSTGCSYIRTDFIDQQTTYIDAKYMSLEVLTAKSIQTVVFWVVTPCSLGWLTDWMTKLHAVEEPEDSTFLPNPAIIQNPVPLLPPPILTTYILQINLKVILQFHSCSSKWTFSVGFPSKIR
jgi:hypothetical protein